MDDDAKMELLFSLLDQDDDGFLDARDLAEGIRKRNADMNFAESLNRAISMVALFDADKDAKLSCDEFKDLVMTMAQELGSSFHDFAEFLILQMLLLDGNEPIEQLAGALMSPEINEEVAAREDLINALTDPRIVQLFKLFDDSGDGVLSFKEVAVGLYQLTNDMENSIKATVELLLAMDKNDDRCLDFEQFVRFILGFCAAAGSTFDDMADGLILLMSNDYISMTEEELAGLYISDDYYSAAKDLEAAVKEEVEVQNVLSYGRLFKVSALREG
jgi:Ca2+-binding EF-hand superfamily protein